jgi:hypothetical protein
MKGGETLPSIWKRAAGLFRGNVIGKSDLTDQAKFLSGTDANPDTTQFGPSNPLPTSPLGEGEPRQYQYPPAFNVRSPQADRRVDTEVLRLLARNYDLLARCLSRRKEEIRTLHWSIQPRERRNKKRMREIQEKYADDIKKLTELFRHPEAAMLKSDNKFIRFPIVDYQTWITALLDDLFIVDSLAIVPRTKLNGELLSLERIQSDTIKVLLDDTGRLPTDGPAYQQWLHGMPRWNFKFNELIYRVYHPVNDSPYGYSLVEQILGHIQLAMRNEAFITSYFTDGSIPPQLFTVPESWSVEQMLEFADIMNSRLSGNPKALREFNIVPNGTQKIDLKPFDYNDKWVHYVAVMTCVLCGVQPHEMGINGGENMLGGKSAGEIASEINDKQTMFMAEFIQSLFTDIIEYYWGNDELAFVFDHLLEKEERERAEINQILITSGQKSIDQVLVENGEEPEGINRFVALGDRIYFLPDLLAGSVKGGVAVNLGQVGGVKMPDDTFTEDLQITQDANNPDIETPNPNQSKDPSAKLDTSHTEAPDDGKPKPPPPPKQPKGTSYPTGPTVNTVKSSSADLAKASSNDNKNKDTHELETIFIAAYYSLFRRVPYDSTMLNPHMVLSAFSLTHSQRNRLYDALYNLKRDVYIESYNKYAREHGLQPIRDIDAHTDELIKRSTQHAVDSIAATYHDELERQYHKLLASGVDDARDMVDKLNTWLRQRNKYKAQQIATTEVSEPWNQAIFNIDHRLGITDDREYWVQPDACVCDNCQQIVNGNPYDYSTAVSLPIPNHPNCRHEIVSRPAQK